MEIHPRLICNDTYENCTCYRLYTSINKGKKIIHVWFQFLVRLMQHCDLRSRLVLSQNIKRCHLPNCKIDVKKEKEKEKKNIKREGRKISLGTSI